MDYLYQSKPSIISRSQWQAATASTYSSNNPEYIIVHHSGETNDVYLSL